MTIYYFCDNTGPGAAVGCPNGNNNNAGTDPALPKQNLVGFSISGSANTYRFARGSSIALTSVLQPGAGLSATNRTIFEDYGHPSFPSSARPILNAYVNASSVGQTCFDLLKRSNFLIRNLKLTGVGGQGTGVSTVACEHVHVDNCDVSEFTIGTQCGEGDAALRIADIKVTNCEIHHNRVHGHFGGADRLLIENCEVHHNGSQNSGRDHNIYIGVTAAPMENITVRNNTLTFNEQYGTRTISASVSMVFHGFFTNLLIEGNTVIDLSCDYGHQGIAVNGVTGNLLGKEGFPNMIIRDNLIVCSQKGGAGITWNNSEDPIVENNVIVLLGGNDFFAGLRWAHDLPKPERGDPTGARARVRNNTIYMQFTPGIGAANITGGLSVAGNDDGGDTVTNNLVVIDSDRTTDLAVAFRVYDRTRASFEDFANNLAFRADAGTLTWSNQYATLALAQAAVPAWDVGSINADPLLVAAPSAANGYSVVLQAGSPAIGASHATKSARLAYGRKVANGTRDIGAEDNGAAVVAPMCPAVRRIV